MRADDPFALAILAVLSDGPFPMSLPRLTKKLDLGASVVMRQLSLMGDAVIGGQPGPGWVRVVQDEERWVVHLTDSGRAAIIGAAASDE